MGSQPTAAPFRLAILEADTPLPGSRTKYGSYGGVFTSLLTRAVAPASLSDSGITISAFDVVANPDPLPSSPYYPALDEVDGVLITGSRHNAFEDDPWILALTEFTRRALTEGSGVRVAGVCFGHQIVSRALGVPVTRSPGGWEVSVTPLKLSEKGKKVFGKDQLKIHQMHRDAALSYPAGAEPLAETDACPVQGMLLPGRAITVQGHPEFTEGIVREILEARHGTGVLSDEIYQSGMDRVADEHDGVLIAQAFLRFLRDK